MRLLTPTATIINTKANLVRHLLSSLQCPCCWHRVEFIRYFFSDPPIYSLQRLVRLELAFGFYTLPSVLTWLVQIGISQFHKLLIPHTSSIFITNIQFILSFSFIQIFNPLITTFSLKSLLNLSLFASYDIVITFKQKTFE